MNTQAEIPNNPPKKWLGVVREKIRYKHYSLRTEQKLLRCIKRFVYFHKMRHPKDMGAVEVAEYLSYFSEWTRRIQFHPSAGFIRFTVFV